MIVGKSVLPPFRYQWGCKEQGPQEFLALVFSVYLFIGNNGLPFQISSRGVQTLKYPFGKTRVYDLQVALLGIVLILFKGVGYHYFFSFLFSALSFVSALAKTPGRLLQFWCGHMLSLCQKQVSNL